MGAHKREHAVPCCAVEHTVAWYKIEWDPAEGIAAMLSIKRERRDGKAAMLYKDGQFEGGGGGMTAAK